jgi:hypothetical protein
VEQVLHVLHALDAPGSILQVLDQLGLTDFAAEDDLAVLGVDVDLSLGHVDVAEDLRLDLAGEGDVVGLNLRLLFEVLRLLGEAFGLRGRGAGDLLT